MIKYDSSNKLFFLNTEKSSYIIKLLENGMLCHWYYGKRIHCDDITYLNTLREFSFSPAICSDGISLSRDTAPQEYPTYGNGDYRGPALIVENNRGQRVNDLVYVSHIITDGKPLYSFLPGFNTATDNVQTLEIKLKDTVTGYDVSLFYTVFETEDAIARHSVIYNTTDADIKLISAQSLSVDMPARDLDFVALTGSWARERHINRQALSDGTLSVESRRGASGHQQNPFAALCSRDATEDSGEVYGFALVYSGNFKISAEVEQFGTTRLIMGINPHNFTYLLAAGESFVTPEAVCVYSDRGFNGMSHSFHDMCRNHLGVSADRSIRHPIVINSWEAMYFDISEQRLSDFARNCRDLGIDTLVMDDGWFGHRDSDNSSLGDWFIDKRKFPNGLKPVIDACHESGLDFGIWIEPEMISKDSELYRAHPDWCIHVDGKPEVESRRQLCLDMSRSEVVNCIYDQISAVLREYDIAYVKWDMNRNITDNGSSALPPERQGEHAHRYILGVYELMRRFTTEFPHILFEGCSGGGGRFDFGALYYMPQIWTSDDSDAIERLKIQYGTSLVYPIGSMTAHVSVCPNHQHGRTTPFKTRGDVAQICSFGYELDVANLTDEERSQITEQIALHRRIEPLIYNGDFYRIISPFEKGNCAWQIVSKDKNTSFAVYITDKVVPHAGGFFLKLKGLDPEKLYSVEPLGLKLHGSTLMNAGIPISHTWGDYVSYTFEINECKE